MGSHAVSHFFDIQDLTGHILKPHDRNIHNHILGPTSQFLNPILTSVRNVALAIFGILEESEASDISSPPLVKNCTTP
jgi:hypothetical protein